MTENKFPKKSRRILGLAGYQSIAVLGVILYHLLPNHVVGGYLGVVLFFVSSGYLLTDHLHKEQVENGKINWLRYAAHRVKRLYPMLLLMFGSSLTYMYFFQKNLLLAARGAVASTLLMYNNWWQILNGSSYFDRFSNQSPYTHLWFLGVQAQLYILVPLTFILLRKIFKNHNGKKFLTLLGLSVLSAVLLAIFFRPENANRAYYGTDTRAFSFVIGAMVAMIWPQVRLKEKIPLKTKKVLNLTGILTLVLVIVGMFIFSDQHAFIYYGGMYGYSLLAGVLLMMVVHPESNFKKWFNGPVIRWLGSRSYAIYLFQYPVMIFYEAKFNVAEHAYWHALIEFVIVLVVSEMATRLLNVLVKRPKKPVLVAALLAVVLFFGVSVAGLVRTPKAEVKDDSAILKEQLEQNQALIDKTQQTAESSAATETTTSEGATTETTAHSVTDTSEETTSSTTTDASTKVPDNSGTTEDATVTALAEKYQVTADEIHFAKNLSLTAVGDSVLLASAPDLLEISPNLVIDGKISRQVYRTVPVLQELNAQGKLADNIVMALGTNGPFSDERFKEVMDVIGTNRKVFWINVKASIRWQDEVNNTLNRLAADYPNLTILNWHDYSINSPAWFYDDLTHPNPEGSIQYTKFLLDQLYANLN
ncbi:acyltransferase family protein [Enterococcus timonensis]|uniref:acyltransferase family protein n=1 Tax=Enterococcus timonensis TaxID=1852364 RepID=UPI0008DB2EB1|nr:acyltransferase family protein [Enterococcus timonensis]